MDGMGIKFEESLEDKDANKVIGFNWAYWHAADVLPAFMVKESFFAPTIDEKTIWRLMLNDCFQAKLGYTTIYLEYELCSTCSGVRTCKEIRDVFVVYNLQIVHKA